MIRPVLLWPDRRLACASAPVPEETFGSAHLLRLVEDVWDTLYGAGGIGLAAVQIDYALRLFVVDAGREPGASQERWVFANPEIQVSGEPEPMNEGCLSLPGVVEVVNRYPQVVVRARDEHGRRFEQLFTGLRAQCVQHEYEHLDGVTIPDKLSYVARERLRSQVRKRSR